ncbi:hypothetical protein QZH41_010868 [Actinostola sp. cb2023]|nr:hypothetical protein QZH41_010868 [Actinostola sp. cb2023]
MAAPEEGSDFTEDQLEIVAHFQDITAIDDMDECRQILERHQWDIETAVQDTFNKAEGAAMVFHHEPHEADDQSAIHDDDDENDDDDVGTATIAATSITEDVTIIRHNQGFFIWMLSVLLFPFKFSTSVMVDILKFVVRLVWPSFFHPRRTAIEDVVKFKEYFEYKYGTTHPTFYQGTYSQALNDAKKELRFLLIYLHCDEHQDTSDFCGCTMNNSGFKEYVNGNMLFWACDVNSAEGYRVSKALRETTYPFLALVSLRDNRMTVVGRMEGIMPVDRYVSVLAQLIADNEPSLVAARAERHERSQTQTLRDEQDAAYHESLLADKEKERRKREELERKKQEEDAKRLKHEASRNKLESIARLRAEKKQQLPEEPDPGTLYDFVFCCEEAPAEFRLSSPFPKKVYELINPDDTLESVGMCSSTTLYVQDTAEDSDSD